MSTSPCDGSKLHSPSERGFTLFEMIVVILIAAIIALLVVPRFINLGIDARVGAIRAGQGAVTNAANLAYMKCKLAPDCVESSGGLGNDVIGPSGDTAGMYYGYPTGLSRPGQFFGIKDWVTMDGFDAIEDYTNTDFQLRGASDPANCKVNYTESFGSGPVVTATVSGC